jgi:hypothetical protein
MTLRIPLFLLCLLGLTTHFLRAELKTPVSAKQSVLAYKITLTDLLRIDIYQEEDLRTMSRVEWPD